MPDNLNFEEFRILCDHKYDTLFDKSHLSEYTALLEAGALDRNMLVLEDLKLLCVHKPRTSGGISAYTMLSLMRAADGTELSRDDCIFLSKCNYGRDFTSVAVACRMIYAFRVADHAFFIVYGLNSLNWFFVSDQRWKMEFEQGACGYFWPEFYLNIWSTKSMTAEDRYLHFKLYFAQFYQET